MTTDTQGNPAVMNVHDDPALSSRAQEPTKDVDSPNTNPQLYPSENPQQQQQQQQPVHEKLIDDPYDPMVPNDLLQYWERKQFEKERIQLENERQQALEQQERLREHLQKEREELARAGNVEQLAQRSMGRGRGISNLPAWMLEQRASERGEDGLAAPKKT